MHFTSLISIATLVLGTYSIPAPDSKHSFGTPTFSSSNLCGTTSWNPNSNARAPLVSDCENLLKEMQKDKKQGFELYGWQPGDKEDDYLPLAYKDTCVFGVSVINANHAPAVIAKGDIADLLRDAMKSYTNGDHVSAVTGELSCLAYWKDYSKQMLKWSIYSF
ncbi:hypothetical protein F4679DRAFT_586191 [Xylaria curta]|nr:hypothetical protein F4679DRAFT_586191 [Xylaria curta]